MTNHTEPNTPESTPEFPGEHSSNPPEFTPEIPAELSSEIANESQSSQSLDPTQWGKVYLIPNVLGDDALFTLPPYLATAISEINIFVVEHIKDARRTLVYFHRYYGLAPFDPDTVEWYTHEQLLKEPEVRKLLLAAKGGTTFGVMSDAGCPGVADPGARVARIAHELGLQVRPLVGPSSILLALMASGMNGQSFAFVGYMPRRQPALNQAIAQLDQHSRKHEQTQIFIEAPYRNEALLHALMANCRADTVVCMAIDLTLETELIFRRSIKQLQQLKATHQLPDIQRRPTVFVLLARV
jgi:16S rRNA (cytidine1402-2'-O)-methyltransferase